MEDTVKAVKRYFYGNVEVAARYYNRALGLLFKHRSLNTPVKRIRLPEVDITLKYLPLAEHIYIYGRGGVSARLIFLVSDYPEQSKFYRLKGNSLKSITFDLEPYIERFDLAYYNLTYQSISTTKSNSKESEHVISVANYTLNTPIPYGKVEMVTEDMEVRGCLVGLTADYMPDDKFNYSMWHLSEPQQRDYSDNTIPWIHAMTRHPNALYDNNTPDNPDDDIVIDRTALYTRVNGNYFNYWREDGVDKVSDDYTLTKVPQLILSAKPTSQLLWFGDATDFYEYIFTETSVGNTVIGPYCNRETAVLGSSSTIDREGVIPMYFGSYLIGYVEGRNDSNSTNTSLFGGGQCCFEGHYIGSEYIPPQIRERMGFNLFSQSPSNEGGASFQYLIDYDSKNIDEEFILIYALYGGYEYSYYISQYLYYGMDNPATREYTEEFKVFGNHYKLTYKLKDKEVVTITLPNYQLAHHRTANYSGGDILHTGSYGCGSAGRYKGSYTHIPATGETIDLYNVNPERIVKVSTKVTELYLLYTYVVENFVDPDYVFLKRVVGVIDKATGVKRIFEYEDPEVNIHYAIGAHNG